MPSPHLSIVGALKSHALKEPERPAVVFVDESLDRLVLTRQKLWDYCRKFTAVLRRKDLGKGAVVCNTLRNSPQRVITELGAVTGGVISMNGQLCFADGTDFIFSLNQGKAKAVILDPEDTKGAFAILKPRLDSYDEETGEVSCPEVPSLKYILSYPLRSATRKSADAFLEDLDKEEDGVHEDISPDEVCQYMCTSGSTSMFKLVAFSSHVIMEFGIAFAGSMGAKEEDMYLNNRPLGWLGGYPAVYLALGTCRVLFDESNDRPSNFSEIQWKIACQEKCAVCFTTPAALFEFNTAREESSDESVKNYRMRTILAGGGPVTKNCMLAALKKLCEEVSVVYASTEAGTMCCLRVRDIEDYEEFKTGYPAPGVQIKVVDDKGEELPVGERGEIQIKSNQSALYYVNDPQNTARAFQPDGWIRLGDVGFVNDRGQVSVIGRDKFAIIRSGVIFYPYVIEGFLRNCPGVSDVIITGVPDAICNEELCAMIKRKPGQEQEALLSMEDVKRFCEEGVAIGKDIDFAPMPGYVLFVEEFPCGGTGKLDRSKVRKQACEMLNIQLLED